MGNLDTSTSMLKRAKRDEIKKHASGNKLNPKPTTESSSRIKRFLNANKNKSSRNNNKNNNNNNITNERGSESEWLADACRTNDREGNCRLNVVNECCAAESFDREWMERMNERFGRAKYADAMLKVNYIRARHFISIEFASIENLCARAVLRDVYAVVGIFVMNGDRPCRLVEERSRDKLDELEPGCKRKFRFKMKQAFDERGVSIERVSICVSLFGKICRESNNNNNDDHNDDDYVDLKKPITRIKSRGEKSNDLDHRLLGGAIINLGENLDQIEI